MTTFLPSFCYYLSVFLTTEYHLLIEVHESLNRIFPVFMRASGDTEISLPHFGLNAILSKSPILYGVTPFYLKSDHVCATVKIAF